MIEAQQEREVQEKLKKKKKKKMFYRRRVRLERSKGKQGDKRYGVATRRVRIEREIPE